MIDVHEKQAQKRLFAHLNVALSHAVHLSNCTRVFEFSVCLSRACLGKRSVVIIESVQKRPVSHLANCQMSYCFRGRVQLPRLQRLLRPPPKEEKGTVQVHVCLTLSTACLGKCDTILYTVVYPANHQLHSILELCYAFPIIR